MGEATQIPSGASDRFSGLVGSLENNAKYRKQACRKAELGSYRSRDPFVCLDKCAWVILPKS
eukprot:1193156-Prorocentrum_minimum.AAC.3